MDVYRGADKVAELGSYDELRVGANKPAFVYEGAELVYPNPVKDGLVLWYDFSGRTNSDAERGVAEDLSGNGNHGTLQNFNYTAESGYDENKLLFDGVDDLVRTDESFPSSQTLCVEMVVNADYDGLGGVVKGSNGTWASNEWGVRDYSNHHRFYYSKGNEMYSIGDILRDIGKTVHYVFQLSSTGAQIYKNGEKLIDIERDGDIRFTTDPLNIGRAYSGSHAGHSYNSIRIYNRPLTASEIAHNYAIEKERFGIE